MANPSPGNSITLRVEAPSSFSATSELAAAVGAAGAAITALDVTESHHETLVVDVTCNTTDDAHAARVKDALNALDGETVLNPPQEPMLDLFSYDGRSAVPAEAGKRLAGVAHG